MNNNFLASNIKVPSAFSSSEIMVEPGEILSVSVMVESVSGAPTTASLAAKLQVAPIEYKGYSWNTDSVSGTQRPWIDVAVGDTYLGHLLIDGAFPASLADQNITTPRIVTRRFKVPPLAQIVRVVLTPTFSGGTSPEFRVTIGASTDAP